MVTGSAASTDSTAPSDGKAGEVKRKKKYLNKAKRKGLVSTLGEIDLCVLVDEVVNDLQSQFAEMESSLKEFVNTLCSEGGTIRNVVEYHSDLFVDLYGECNKVGKTSFVQFQIKWHKYCSAFLLRDGLSLLEIEIEENHSVSDIRQVWLEFCAANNTPVPESNRVMMNISSVVYSALLEHVSNHHSTPSIETESPVETVIDGDDVYYRFGGAALCEMLKKGTVSKA